MIKIENVEVAGFEAAIRGMRNPLNSWDKSDSIFDFGLPNIDGQYDKYFGAIIDKNMTNGTAVAVGPLDKTLMEHLASGGSCHAKYRRMIVVYVDIIAPLYWWKEFDTYKVGTVSNSCSTMHTIHKKEFDISDFSTDKMVDLSAEVMENVILALNMVRYNYNNADDDNTKKLWWYQMIQLLPSSYNQRRTIMLNYEVLSRIYFDRKNHKLDEWGEFCKWIETLPLAEGIIYI